MFLLIVFSVWSVVLIHVLYRTQALWGGRIGSRVLFSFLGFLVGFSYVPARIWLSTGKYEGLATGFTYASVLVVGFVAILWTLVAIFDLGRILVWPAKRFRVREMPAYTRRKLASGIWLAAGLLSMVGWICGFSTPAVTKLRLTVPGGVEQRLLLLSDFHLGVNSSVSQWRRTLARARSLDPEVLLIPGDLLDDGSSRARSQLAMIREFFPEERVFVTFGNHDSYNGHTTFSELCGDLNLRLLRQETEILAPGLMVAGIDDAQMNPLSRSVKEVRDRMEGAALLLSHRPAAASLLEDRPMTLILSGHTHGGQTLPMVFLVSLANGRFRAGHYSVGEADLYVSKGTGVWGPPMRLLAYPEMALIQVEPGNAFDVTEID